MPRLDLSTVIPYAERAPSVLNTQPWICTVVGQTVEIRADRSRGLAVLDPTGRQLMISCGAAVEFAEVAVRGLGWSAVTEILPDPAEPDLLGVVHVGAELAADAMSREFLTAITRRYTDRGAYEPQAISSETLNCLHTEIADRGAWLRSLDRPGDRLAVIQALGDADAVEASDPAYQQEIDRWLRTRPAPEGIPTASLKTGSAAATWVTDVPTRVFHGHADRYQPIGDAPPPVVARDTLLMLGTDADTPRSWMNAGRAVGWLQLRLTREGLTSQPLGQLIDIESARTRVGRQLGLIGHVQFVLRTGKGHGQPATRRRHIKAAQAGA